MHKKINIVHLIPNLNTGGAENVILNLFQIIDKNKFNIFIIYWENKQELLKKYNICSNNIKYVKLKNPLKFSSVFILIKMLKRLKTDIIHTHFIDANLIGFISSAILRVPHLVHIHSFPFPQKLSHCIRYRIISIFVWKFICVSETVKNYLVTKAKINKKKLVVVHNGVNLENCSNKKSFSSKDKLKKSFNIGKNCKVVGNVSRLIEEKGQKFILYAIPKVLNSYPNTKFLIVGDGEYKKELEKIAKSLNINNDVIFTGTRTDVPELLDIMDIFIFPAINEALGLCVLEAMSMSKPVIAANHAAMPEIIENNKDGVLVTPNISTKIEKAILDLLNHSKKAQKLSKSAYIKAQKFSLKQMVKKIEKIYDSI